MNKTLKFASILNSESYKALKITGLAGDIITSHKVDENSVLFIQNGSVTYKDADKEVKLQVGEAFEITKEITHEVVFHDDSQLILIRPNNAIMKFNK